MKHRVVVADDHPIFRKGLVEILQEMDDIEIVAEVADGLSAYKSIIALRPEIAILDVEMPGLSGIDVCKKVLNEKSSTKFIVLTMHKEKDFFNDAMEMGVSGYILKDNAIAELMDCIKQVLVGKRYTSPGIDKLLTQYGNREQQNELKLLTATEKVVLKLIADGKTSAEIGALLFISPNTVDNHRANIVKKIGLEGKNSLLKFAIRYKDSL